MSRNLPPLGILSHLFSLEPWIKPCMAWPPEKQSLNLKSPLPCLVFDLLCSRTTALLYYSNTVSLAAGTPSLSQDSTHFREVSKFWAIMAFLSRDRTWWFLPHYGVSHNKNTFCFLVAAVFEIAFNLLGLSQYNFFHRLDYAWLNSTDPLF